MIYVVATLLAVSIVTNVWLALQYKRINRKVNFVETTKDEIEEMLDLKTDLNRFGRAILEIRRLDPAGIMYREPR